MNSLRHVVTYQSEGRPHVVSVHRFRWLAVLIATAYSKAYPGAMDVGVDTVDVDPETVIRICEQRDAAMDARDSAEAALGEIESMQRNHHPAVEVLYGLVARSDDGRWVWVHDMVADEPVPPHLVDVLDRVLA